MSTDQRLQILTEEEIAEIYAHPEFNPAERSHYFSLPGSVLNQLKIGNCNGRSTSTKLFFIMQYGYFKAKHQFFNANYDEAKKDVLFIMEHYMPNDTIPDKLPTRKIQRRTKENILQMMKFSDDKDKIGMAILKKAGYLVRKTQNPIEIFNETIKHLEDKRMVLPKYSQLQDKIGAALKHEEQRLIRMVKRHITKSVRKTLDNLFQSDEAFYNITELKFDAKSFQTKEMKAELRKLALCQPIYNFAINFLPKLSLSHSMINYYSNLAKLYNVNRLQSIPQELAYLYLICYVQSRCERLINNLIQAFIYYVDKYHNDAKKYAKNNQQALDREFDQYKISIGKLMGLYTDKKIKRLSGSKIQKLAFDVMPEEQILTVSKSLLGDEKSQKKQGQMLIWKYHKGNYRSLLINLRPLFLAIDFKNDNGLEDLFKASRFLKTLFNKGRKLKNIPLKRIPIAHIKPKTLLDCFIGSIKVKNNKIRKIINPYQYEFYIYRAIRENLKKSKVYVNNSIGYKSFDAEIKIDPNWDKKGEKILKDLNNKILLAPIDDTLIKLEEILEPLIKRTNKRALSGDNKHIKIIRHRDGSIDLDHTLPKKE